MHRRAMSTCNMHAEAGEVLKALALGEQDFVAA